MVLSLRAIFHTAAFTAVLLALSPAYAQIVGVQATLDQYVSDLQKNPDDIALREKIIGLVRTMKKAPAIPEAARRHYVIAITMRNDAKKIDDYREAIDEFKSALLLAPWWGDANRDLGLALEAAQRYDEAINALNLYIATEPGSDIARSAQDEIYKIEAKKRVAQKGRVEAAVKAQDEAKAKAEAEVKAKLDSVEGAWASELMGQPNPNFIMRIYKRETGEWVIGFPNSDRMYAYDIRQTGRSILFTRMMRGADPELNTDYYNLTLTPDGSKLVGTLRSVSISGNNPHWVTDEATWYRQ